jgi:hypothetical protein
MISNTNKVYFGNQEISQVYVGDNLVFGVWTPANLGEDIALWLDATDSSTITLNGSNVSQWSDKSNNNRHAIQGTATLQPTYDSVNNKVVFDKVDDLLLTNIPSTSGTLVLATPNGTAAYGVNIPSGNYTIGSHDNGKYMPDNAIIGQIITSTAMSEADKSNAIAWLREKGGGNNYGTVTNFSSFWRAWTELTSFPLLDTSQGVLFQFAWYNCSSLTSFPVLDTSNSIRFQFTWYGCSSLTTFPLIDVRKGELFTSAWQNCSNLTNFPANFFDGVLVTTFSDAFTNTNLSQQSIDNILVSIESNGTNNGTFNQSGGSAPSATGEAAITALRNRGWSITVTGGF